MAYGPNILDSGMVGQDELPNILPAGEAPWLKQQPGMNWPGASTGTIPEINVAWLKANLPQIWQQKTGQMLEPGTGFAGQGPSSAIQFSELPPPNFSFGFPPFFLPPMQGPPPPEPPGEAQSQTNEPGILGDLLQLGEKLLKGSTSGSPEILTNEPPKVSLTGDVSTEGFDFRGSAQRIEALKDMGVFNRSGFSPVDLQGNPVGGANNPYSLTGEAPTNGIPNLDGSFNLEGQFFPPGVEWQPSSFTGPSFQMPSIPSAPGLGGPAVSSPEALFPSGASPATLSNFQATGAAAALAAAPQILKAAGLDDAARFVGNPAVQGPGAFAIAALANNPAGWIAATALPAILGGMKIFDVGGKAKRTARDAEFAQGMSTEMQNMLALAKYNPEFFKKIYGYQNWQEADVFRDQRLKEIYKNGRIPREAVEQIYNMGKEFVPLRNDIIAGKVTSEDLKDVDVAPLSEGETWRLYTLTPEYQQEQARMAQEAYQMGGGDR